MSLSHAALNTGGRLKFRTDATPRANFSDTPPASIPSFGTSGIESAYNDELLGESIVISMQDIEDSLFGSGEQGDIVRVTINSEMQQIAREQLGDQRGSVIAMDPENGEILAMWSNPSFDPNATCLARPQVRDVRAGPRSSPTRRPRR